MHMPDSKFVQALRKEVILGPILPRQLAQADVFLLKIDLHGLLGDDLQRAVQSTRLLAVQQVTAGALVVVLSHVLAQARRKEDRVRINLHCPIAFAVEAISYHRVPYPQEPLHAMPCRGSVWPQLRAAPGRRYEDCGLQAAVVAQAQQHLLALTERGVLITGKNARVPHHLGLDQANLPFQIAHDRHAEERGRAWHVGCHRGRGGRGHSG
mmetsp:Transcript_43775/g.126510  ORF Transcript_43775/g.126510 Transcript_43775/m.126510 type:complete len:210 (-) Transcript_43775:2503-3132(-)